MKHFFSLLAHELRAQLLAPATYTATVLFLLLMGGLYILILFDFSVMPKDNLPGHDFFQLFWLPVLFMVPLLTMKSIAEERRLGTLETLMTTPVTATEIVLSKFMAAYFFYCVLWAFTLAFPWLVNISLNSELAREILLDKAVLKGGYLFVAISGMLFIAVGIFASSLTRSQLVAGMLCFSILFLLILGPPIIVGQNPSLLDWMEKPLNYLHIFRFLEDFMRGVVDTRPFFYYFSTTAIVLGLSGLIVESKA